MDLDDRTKLEIYKLVLKRYKDLITERESRNISEIRQRVSPYSDFIRAVQDRLSKDTVPYEYKSHFFTMAQRAMEYVRSIRTCEFAFTFWVEFKEMDELKIGTAMDKAILLAAILRSFESDDARVMVTKKGKSFVKFSWQGLPYLFSPDSGSLLAGTDVAGAFADDPVAYCFNDLMYENYEET